MPKIYIKNLIKIILKTHVYVSSHNRSFLYISENQYTAQNFLCNMMLPVLFPKIPPFVHFSKMTPPPNFTPLILETKIVIEDTMPYHQKFKFLYIKQNKMKQKAFKESYQLKHL